MNLEHLALDKLSAEEKRALLKKLVAQAVKPSEYPLTSAQHGIWLGSRLNPDGWADHLLNAYRLRGPLDRAALERGLAEIVARHQALRTRFEMRGDHPVQVVSEAEVRLEDLDLSAVPGGDRFEQAHALAIEETRKPFDLERGPMFRFRLIRLDRDDAVLLLILHHIVADNWSFKIINQELQQLYAAFGQGKLSPLAPLPIQFGDVALATVKDQPSAVIAAQIEYWQQQLAGLEICELPPDRERPALQSFRGETLQRLMPVDLADGLEALAQRTGNSLFTVALAAFQTLLFRHLTRADISCGVPYAHRAKADYEPLIGFFINTLVMRTDFSGNPSFRALLNRVQETTLNAYEAADVPFGRLVEALGKPRDMSRNPLVPIVFQGGTLPELNLDGLVVDKAFEADYGIVRSDLECYLTVEGSGLRCLFIFNADLYERATIDALARRLETLLRAVIAAPETPVARLALFPEEERDALFAGWHGLQRPREGVCLHQLIEGQARALPNATAVVCQAETLSYAELDRRAERLAGWLSEHGVGPDATVGICMERSSVLAVSLLAVLKAGGAYLPLDPGYPKKRLAFMIEDAAPALVLTQAALKESLPAGSVLSVAVDQDWESLVAASPQPSTDVKVTPDHLAYVIFTSGSTGRPKGSMISHRGICNTLLWRQDTFPLGPGDCVLQTTSFSFDASVWEFFGPLIAGACLALSLPPGPEGRLQIPELVKRHGVTAFQLPPSWLRVFLSEPGLEELTSLRHLITGAEPVSRELQQRVFDRLGCRFSNHYGPTEASLDVTVWHCRRDDAGPFAPIGTAIDNTRVYLLDTHLEPVVPGQAGELFIGGPGLARGYLGRPDLTAERFPPDPYGEPGARLYRSGDLGKQTTQGDIQFMGRIDDQVKIRGFRVELGEIEAALLHSPAVAQTAVVARQDGATKHLVAYVVPAREHAHDDALDETLRTTLAEGLPDHMVPAAFVMLDKLPLLPNGKLDRKALPTPDFAPNRVTYAAPRGERETALISVWQEVLGREPVGIHDDFFALGGDSIMAIQIVAKAKAQGLTLSPQQIFKDRTVARLAAAPDRKPPTQAEPYLDATGEVPLTPIQCWFFEQERSHPEFFNQAFLLRPTEALDAERLARALGILTEVHDALRLRFQRDGNGWRASFASEGPHLDVQVRNLSEAADPEQALDQAVKAAHAGLDIGKGPVGRAVLFELGGGLGSRLLIVIHHLAVDGVSWRILLADLELVYRQLTQGVPPTSVVLPAPTTSWPSWSARLAQFARSPAIARELAFWNEQPRLADPTRDFDNGENSHGSERTLIRVLSQAETEALLTRVHTAYATRINDVLLTALALAFKRQNQFDGLSGLNLDLEGHGREALFDEVDLSRTVGWFTSLFPIALDLGAAKSPGEVLKAVKEQLRRIPNAGIGYGLLRYLDPSSAASLQSRPKSRLLFNYLGRFVQAETDLLVIAEDGAHAGVHPDDPRAHDHDIYALVQNGCLRVYWRYSDQRHRGETVTGLADAFVAALRELIDHCLEPGRFGRTPSDFPLVDLGQDRIDDLMGKHGVIEDILPLTPMQQGLVFHSLYSPESLIYTQQICCGLRGDLDENTYRQAWQSAADNHPILRALFSVDERVPVQIVLPTLTLDWQELDWRGLGESEIETRLQDFLRAERRRGFDWETRSPQRIRLIRVAAEKRYFVWTHHHALLDGWSLPILLTEVGQAYEALRAGSRPNAARTRPFRDYVAWLEEQDRDRAKAFWRERLGGFSEMNQLPVLRDQKQSGREQGNRELRLSREQTQVLTSFVQGAGLTLSTLVQAAWALLIGHYSGRRDVVFGATVAGRPPELTGSEGMVGLFINTIPIRIDTGGKLAVRDWLRNLAERQIQAMPFEVTPVVEAQAQSDVPPGQPLFETMLVFENYPMLDAMSRQWTGLAVEDVYFTEKVEYPLLLQVMAGRDLVFNFKYDPGRIGESALTRLQGHLIELLLTICKQPDMRLDRLAFLARDEQRRILFDWNDTRADYAANQCMHQLFEAQVRTTPAAIAASCRSESMTYAELNRAANRLAHFLIERGVRANVLVGICSTRSLDMIVGTLAILKAGGAYVPMETTWPEDRIAYILAEANAPLWLTQSPVAASMASIETPAICLDRESFEAYRDGNPDVDVQASDLAYIIFTSGSTGRPKGVILQHRPVINLIEWVNRTYAVGCGDRLLFITSLCFDLSVYDLFGVLACGGEILIATEADIAEPERLAGLLDSGITFWDSAPAALNQLTEFLPAPGAGNAKLRLVFLSGDWIPLGLPSALRGAFPNVAVIGLGGATEATIWSNYFPIGEVSPAWNSIPYGYPIQNAAYYILDSELRPCPIGVPGDLYIGGRCLSRGYFNQPDLTAQRYIPNPYDDLPGGVLYTTGDRARWFPDGKMEFLGRLDHQVKIRGFRIELGEIESVLLEHEAIRGAVVIVREDRPGDRRLAAYLLKEEGQQAIPDRDGLRAFLSAKLPEYMLPGAFVTLDRFPVTGNGKLDRKALPAPESNGQATRLAARNEREGAMAAIWSEVLGVADIGIEDNFFELGGHSLLATQIVSRIRKHFQTSLALRDLFAYPTVAGLTRIVAAGIGPEPFAELALEAVDPASVPLSFAQERLWFLDQLEPNNWVYNIPATLAIAGPLQIGALRRAFAMIANRHQALRTRFPARDGQPAVQIAAAVDLAPGVVDLTGLAFELREATAMALAERESRATFDLERGPLARFGLIRLATDRHWLTINLHHIVADGWSLSLLLREAGTLYGRLTGGNGEPLKPLAVQFGDFAHWERQWLAGPERAQEIEFWKTRLAGAPALLSLPLDCARPPIQSFRGGIRQFEIDAQTLGGLKELGRTVGATLFMTLQAAYAVLLSKYSGQDDIVIGTPVARRDRPELESIIGLFVNTLPLRNDLAGDPTFLNFLERTRIDTLEAFSHQDVPFEHIVKALNPDRNLSYSPLFQAFFVMQNVSLDELHLPGLTQRTLLPEHIVSKFDITLSFLETEAGLTGIFEYSSDLFRAATITRMIGHLQCLLTSIVDRPHGRISALALMTEAETRHLFAANTRTESAYPHELGIHGLFEIWVQKTPQAAALVWEDRTWTYAELDRLSEAMAENLAALNLAPESRVGVCCERSAHLVAGLLAVLKAGHVYVPLDPSHPRQRLAYIAADAQLGALIGEPRLFDPLPDGVAAIRLDIATLGERANTRRREPRPLPSGKAAYTIYTSGSTGKPKGVTVTHSAVVNFLSSMARVPGLDATDRLLAVTTISFDIAALELFLPLSVGATAVLASTETAGDPHLLSQALDRQSVTVMQATPATWQMLCEAGWQGKPDLRIFCGGEALPPALAQQLQTRCSQLWNLFGPTETTIWSSAAHIDGARVSIGKPIANTSFAIVDRHGRAVPSGIPGELCIGGHGLARGYHGRPDLTAERFVPDPFGSDPGARVYRTGDLVRFCPDGAFDCLGRLDHQIKIRGFRIEPGEIESTLAQHESVLKALVLVLTASGAQDDHQLCAYLKTDSGQEPADLRDYLAQRLPHYMIPTFFVCLDAFPLTPAGKIDRGALPAPHQKAKPTSLRPRNAIEAQLAAIWAEVLPGTSEERIPGVEDGFFELGGHSLLATRVLARVQAKLGIAVPVRTLFARPTIAGLAAWIEEHRGDRQTRPDAPRALDRTRPLPLSFAQQRLWYLDRLHPGDPLYNIQFSVGLEGELDVDRLRQALLQLIQRHEILRSRFDLEGNLPVQIALDASEPRLETVDFSGLPAATRENRLHDCLHEQAMIPFDLKRGDLFHCLLIKTGESAHLLAVCVHHIVFDGWSIGVMLRDLTAFYSGDAATLPELEFQYADYAVWERDRFQADAMDARLDYWRGHLRGATPTPLPYDRPKPERPDYRGGTHALKLSPELSAALYSLSAQRGTTLFAVLLAALKTLLYRHSGQPDMVIGTDLANRDLLGLEPQLGFYINLIALRSDLSGNPSFAELVDRAGATVSAARDQEVPFDMLVKALQFPRESDGMPLVRTNLVMQNFDARDQATPGLRWQLQPPRETPFSRFELVIFADEKASGLELHFIYRKCLFDKAIPKLAGHFANLLEGVAAKPDLRLNAIEILSTTERTQAMMQQKKRKDFKSMGLRQARRRAVDIEAGDLVAKRYLDGTDKFPLVIEPALAGVDAAEWAEANRATIESELLGHGAILLRGFEIASLTEFEHAAAAVCPALYGNYGDLPPEKEGRKIYKSTPYPAEKSILFHNESSHTHRWPARQFFYCVHAAETGGETPIVDCRRLFRALGPELRELFAAKGLLYQRNFIPGLDVSWQEFFKTEGRAEVERHCREAGIAFEWREDGGLRTRQRAPAIIQHPETGEPCFFNQIQLHHINYLDGDMKASIAAIYAPEDLPRNVYFGDGSALDDTLIDTLTRLYDDHAVAFPWQVGDLLILDNMMVAHARRPFTGTRKINVAMGNMIEAASVAKVEVCADDRQ